MRSRTGSLLLPLWPPLTPQVGGARLVTTARWWKPWLSTRHYSSGEWKKYLLTVRWEWKARLLMWSLMTLKQRNRRMAVGRFITAQQRWYSWLLTQPSLKPPWWWWWWGGLENLVITWEGWKFRIPIQLWLAQVGEAAIVFLQCLARTEQLLHKSFLSC